MIAIVDHSRDVHVRVVKDHLEKKGARVFVCDPHELGAGADLSFWPQAPERTEWRRRDGTMMRLSDVRAVWFRPKVSPGVPLDVTALADRQFIEGEWSALIRGAFLAFGAPQINPFRAMVEATKPYQMRLARAVGLAVPETLITSSARRAREFVAGPGDVVHKVMAAPDDRLLATKQWEAADADWWHALELCPSIFQRQIAGTRELRITAVGERLFAAEFSPAFVDGRLDAAAPHVAHELPRAVAHGLLTLLERLSLAYAAIDMRIDAHGEYQFLEANPAGQFLWIEIATGMPISAAVADLLYAMARGRYPSPAEHAVGAQTSYNSPFIAPCQGGMP
jgi:hypothetical protein